jgi:hypothetical protein
MPGLSAFTSRGARSLSASARNLKRCRARATCFRERDLLARPLQRPPILGEINLKYHRPLGLLGHISSYTNGPKSTCSRSLLLFTLSLVFVVFVVFVVLLVVIVLIPFFSSAASLRPDRASSVSFSSAARSSSRVLRVALSLAHEFFGLLHEVLHGGTLLAGCLPAQQLRFCRGA